MTPGLRRALQRAAALRPEIQEAMQEAEAAYVADAGAFVTERGKDLQALRDDLRAIDAACALAEAAVAGAPA